MAQRVVRRHLDQRDPAPSGSAIHISTSPHGSLPALAAPAHRVPQLLVRRCRVRHLEPELKPGRGGCLGTAGDFQQTAAEEVDDPALRADAEFPVDGEAQRVAVERPRALGVGGPQQYPAAQYMDHAGDPTQGPHAAGLWSTAVADRHERIPDAMDTAARLRGRSLSASPPRPMSIAGRPGRVGVPRGGQRDGWTTEADILEGQRTDPEGVPAVMRRTGAAGCWSSSADGELVACCQLEHRGEHAYFGMFAVRPELQGARPRQA